MADTTKVFGPPGTGKTTFLLDKVQEEIARGVHPSEIIYTSFTKAAAGEARQRALEQFLNFQKEDFPYFSTIHSICYHRNRLSPNMVFSSYRQKKFGELYHYEFSLEVREDDLKNALDTDLRDRVLSTVADYCEFFIGWMHHKMLSFDEAYRQFITHTDGDVPGEFTKAYLSLYMERRAEYKRKEGLWDYSDMLEQALKKELCPDVKVVVTDELQDSSPLLFAVTEMWAKRAERVYVGGDPEQCIFEWSGADPDLMLDMKCDSTVVLKQSHRCSPAVHELAHRVQERMRKRYEDDNFIPTKKWGSGECRKVGDIDWLALYQEGSIFYLHRTRWLIDQALPELISAGVPFINLRGKSPLQKQLARSLHVAYQLREGKYVSMPQLASMVDQLPARLWFERGAKAEIKRKGKDATLSVNAGNLRSLGFSPEFLKQMNEGVEGIFPGDMEDKAYLRRLYDRYGGSVLDITSSTPHLKVGTYHSVKGAEADIVVLNPTFTWRVKREFEVRQDPEHRVMYVGITRARKKVLVLLGDGYVL